MKTAVVYYSLGGKTKSYALAEASARKAVLIELTPEKEYNPFTAFFKGCPQAMKQKNVPLVYQPDLSEFERVVLMAPVWAGYPAPPFNSAVELLPFDCLVEVVLTAGSGNCKNIDAVKAKIEAQDCIVVSARTIRSSSK